MSYDHRLDKIDTTDELAIAISAASSSAHYKPKLRTTTWANRGNAYDYAGEQVFFSDLGVTGYSDGVNWKFNDKIVLSSENSVSAATNNTTLIQTALNNVGEVRVFGIGDCYINNTLLIGDYTNFIVENKLNIRLFPGTNKTMLKTKTINDAGVGVTVNWTAGIHCPLLWTNHGKSVGDYIWLTGATQSEYRGIFVVYSVTDENNIVIILQRKPLTAATGTILAKTPTFGTTVDIRGSLDYDQPNNNDATGIDTFAIILSGVKVNLLAATVIRAKKYCVCAAAMKDCKISNILSLQPVSDILKVYGPIFGLEIDGIFGASGDDVLSLQGREPAPYSSYDFSNGDILNVKIKNIAVSNPHLDTGNAVRLYASVEEYIGEIDIDHVDMQSKIVLGTNELVVSGARIGRVSIKNLIVRHTYSDDLAGIVVGIKGTVENLLIENFDMRSNLSGIDAMAIYATTTIKLLTIRNIKWYTTEQAYFCRSLGIINTLIIENNVFDSATYGVGRFFSNGYRVKNMIIRSNNIKNIAHIMESTAASQAGNKITVEDNYLDSSFGILNLTKGANITLKDNTGAAGDYGLLRVDTAGEVYTITSSGNNCSYTTTPVIFVVGTVVLSMNGIDFGIDLTKLTRTVAGQMAKPVANIGTVIAGNVVVNDNTNTTGSWKQLSNTTLVY